MLRTLLRAALRAGALAEPLYGGPITIDGNTLDPAMHAVLSAARAARLPKPEEMAVPEARTYAARALAAFDAAPCAMARVIDTAAPGAAGPIPVRIYQPAGARPTMLVFFHGGGGVIGSVDGYDAIARCLAARTGAMVASVAYRLAPEHPHPAAIDDALAAWTWACERASALGVARGRIGVAGDSFGGLLAAWVERRGRPSPAVVGLIYPWVDLTMAAPSIATFADGFLLTRAMLTWFRGHYAPDPASHRDASPLHLEVVGGAAPTIVVTAGFDPLRDEGRAYADRLAAGGGRVIYRCEPDQVHGFIGLTGGLARSAAATERLADDLAAAL